MYLALTDMYRAKWTDEIHEEWIRNLLANRKDNGLDPYHYYVKLLKSLPHCKTVEDYEKLSPWNIKLDYAKAA